MTDLVNLKTSLEDANLIIRALGNLPYAQVYTLIHNLQHQIGTQLAQLEQEKGRPIDQEAIKAA